MERKGERYELYEELLNVLLWFHNYSKGYLIPAYYRCHIQDAFELYSKLDSTELAFPEFRDAVMLLKSETIDLIENGKKFGEAEDA